jgi:hypothetical protein
MIAAEPTRPNWEILKESTGAWIGLIVAIAILTFVVYRIRTWYREDEGPAGDAQQLLAETKEMYRSGALTDAEYRSIQSRLSRRAVDAVLGKPRPDSKTGTPISTDESEK